MTSRTEHKFCLCFHPLKIHMKSILIKDPNMHFCEFAFYFYSDTHFLNFFCAYFSASFPFTLKRLLVALCHSLQLFLSFGLEHVSLAWLIFRTMFVFPISIPACLARLLSFTRESTWKWVTVNYGLLTLMPAVRCRLLTAVSNSLSTTFLPPVL